MTEAQTNRIAAQLPGSARTHVSGLAQGNLTIIAIERILYFQAGQGYVDVVWPEGSMLIEDSLRSLEQEFGGRFLRIHRNALVAQAHVSGLRRDDSGNYSVRLRGSEVELPVSRRLLSQVKSRLR